MKQVLSITLLTCFALLYGREDNLLEKNEKVNFRSGQVLAKYKKYLEQGTYEGFESNEWPEWREKPKSRHHTFTIAFENFEKNSGKIVVELGTTRSFTHGGLPGCNQDWPGYWTPQNPENWDWGAGSFTRVAAECLAHLNPTIYTIDLEAAHIARCKIITKDFAPIMRYYVCSSESFLRTCDLVGKIDLLYLDTGNMTPIEPTARLHLAEAKIIVERDLLSPNGIILIDDVRNQTPKKFGEKSELGKAKYSIPYFLQYGYEIVSSEYQVILKKRST